MTHTVEFLTRRGVSQCEPRLSRDDWSMTTIYYDHDADPEVLAAQTVAVVGYGNQGRSWALNLRDSGCEPVVCVRRDASREQAVADGFSVHEVAEAGQADVICILVPDDVVPLLDVRPGPTSCVIVASGYTLAFGRLEPPGDSGLVAPRMLGPEVRRCYEEGVGFITAVGVHHDATGHALQRVLSVAHAIGGLKQGAIELTPEAGGRAGPRGGTSAVPSPHRREQRVRPDHARARDSPRGDRHRTGALRRSGANLPAPS